MAKKPAYQLPTNRIMCPWIPNTKEEREKTGQYYAPPMEIKIEIMTLNLNSVTLRYRSVDEVLHTKKARKVGDCEISSLMDPLVVSIEPKGE